MFKYIIALLILYIFIIGCKKSNVNLKTFIKNNIKIILFYTFITLVIICFYINIIVTIIFMLLMLVWISKNLGVNLSDFLNINLSYILEIFKDRIEKKKNLNDYKMEKFGEKISKYVDYIVYIMLTLNIIYIICEKMCINIPQLVIDLYFGIIVILILLYLMLNILQIFIEFYLKEKRKKDV